MADFTFTSACSRAVAKVKDKTWINAFACRATTGGKYAVRVQRKMASTSAATRQYGGWTELTDDAAV